MCNLRAYTHMRLKAERATATDHSHNEVTGTGGRGMRGRRTGQVLARFIYTPRQPHPALVSSADRDGGGANTDKHSRLRSPLTACSRHHNVRSLLCTAVTPSGGQSWPPFLACPPSYTWRLLGRSGNRPQRRLGCDIIPARTLALSSQRPAVDDRARLSRYLSAAGLAPFW